ncbi:MAG: hypothetical protein OXC95_08555 [Dehalococcoidia bacterium]|nr:hypothetical protein [Dehalococcoidia bacterium]
MADRQNQYGPRPHGMYLSRNKRGAAQIAVTRARRGSKGGGRRIKTLEGRDRDIAYPYLSGILYDHTGKRLRFDTDMLTNEYHTISEDAAIQMLLLMDAVKQETSHRKAQKMAQAIANMHHCEARWWHAHHTNKHRPRKVMQALELMYV